MQTPFLEIDKSVSDFLLECANPTQHIVQIFTKVDKLNQKEQNELRRIFPEALMVSSSKKKGMSKVVTLIYDILNEKEQEHVNED